MRCPLKGDKKKLIRIIPLSDCFPHSIKLRRFIRAQHPNDSRKMGHKIASSPTFPDSKWCRFRKEKLQEEQTLSCNLSPWMPGRGSLQESVQNIQECGRIFTPFSRSRWFFFAVPCGSLAFAVFVSDTKQNMNADCTTNEFLGPKPLVVPPN